jgi:glutamine---fructose-6-phosphate transaminase (isomerizing)
VTSHMRREIAEQPAAVAATLAQVAEPAAVLATAVRERGLDRVVLVARGTSDHVALYARYLLEARSRPPEACARSSLRAR